MKRSILPDIIAFFFIFLFLYTGAIKLTEIQTFKQQLSSSPLMSSLAGTIAWALPAGELLLAVALFIPRTRLKAMYVTTGLMSLFTIYVITILFIDNEITCSCGGIIEELTPKQHVAFNSACVMLAVIGIITLRKQQPTRQFKRLTISSVAALFAVVGWLLIGALMTPMVRKSGLEGRLIPSFSLQLTDSATWLKTDDIPSGRSFIVMGFEPWCKHCQQLTGEIKTQMQNFRNIPIYYITPAGFEDMRTFYAYFKLDQYPNITMGRDSANIYFPYFHAHSTPLITIYDAKRRLKKVLRQFPTVEQLLQEVQN